MSCDEKNDKKLEQNGETNIVLDIKKRAHWLAFCA